MNFQDIINARREGNQETRFLKFNLKFNPFPQSGTANINEPGSITKELLPIDSDVEEKIARYVADSLYAESDTGDHKLIGTITGDYGTGKTQLLLFAKWLIQDQPKKAYVVYLNNPGTKISELIGSIIESIGREQFKRYLWNQVIEAIDKDREYKEQLLKFTRKSQGSLFGNEDPFSQQNRANHKLFLDAFLKQINNRKKVKELNNLLKEIIIEIFIESYDKDSVIADYFYNIISEDFGINKTWETITSGSGKYLENRAVKLLNAIIDIVERQGFERFYLLVDEFEDITSGRLTKKEVDNYSHNLRALIDKERRWCLLLAMTSEALSDLKKISPPLVDRLTDRLIEIIRLTDEDAIELIKNYLNLAYNDTTPVTTVAPFDIDTIKFINNKTKGLPRLILRLANFLIERGAEDKSLTKGQLITEDFAKKHLDN